MVRQQLVIGAALLAGAAIGFLAKPAEKEAAETSPSTVASRSGGPIADAGAEASAAALRARVRELESQIAALRAGAGNAATNAVVPADAPPQPPVVGRRGSMREMMEDMRKNDPARFVQMTNRFAEMRRSRQERQQARADFLSSVDVSLLSEDRRKTHVAYQELLERREALFEKMGDIDMSEDERHGLWREMRGIGEEMRRLANAERDTLLSVIAGSIGLEGDAAAELVETVKDVCDATETHGGRHGGGPPRRDR